LTFSPSLLFEEQGCSAPAAVLGEIIGFFVDKLASPDSRTLVKEEIECLAE